MSASSVSSAGSPWSLARILMLILAGAFMGLLADIRVEHVEVVRKSILAWTPIVYSALMAIACLLAVAFWTDTSRLIMRIAFLVAFVVGGLGFYLHNHGNLVNVLSSTVNAWTDPTMKHPHGPPQTAPLAFAGLGLLGVVGTLRRYNGTKRS